MDVTNKEAFRLGFLTRCAEEGLTGEELHGRIKQAIALPTSYAVPALAVLGGLALASGQGGSLGTIAGLPSAVGLAGGAALGYGAAKMTEPDISADDIKAQELADTYRIYAKKMEAARKARMYRRNPLS